MELHTLAALDLFPGIELNEILDMMEQDGWVVATKREVNGDERRLVIDFDGPTYQEAFRASFNKRFDSDLLKDEEDERDSGRVSIPLFCVKPSEYNKKSLIEFYKSNNLREFVATRFKYAGFGEFVGATEPSKGGILLDDEELNVLKSRIAEGESYVTSRGMDMFDEAIANFSKSLVGISSEIQMKESSAMCIHSQYTSPQQLLQSVLVAGSIPEEAIRNSFEFQKWLLRKDIGNHNDLSM